MQLQVVEISKLKLGLIISIVIALSLMLSLYFFYDPSEVSRLFPKCPFYSLTNLYCPGCGSQRAVHQILNGHIITGLRHNYLIGLLAVVLGYQTLLYATHELTDRRITNLLHQTKTTKAILVMILLFWVFRNINVFPFTELAP